MVYVRVTYMWLLIKWLAHGLWLGNIPVVYDWVTCPWCEEYLGFFTNDDVLDLLIRSFSLLSSEIIHLLSMHFYYPWTKFLMVQICWTFLVAFKEPSVKIHENMFMMFMYAFYLFWNIGLSTSWIVLIVWILSYLSQRVGLCMILTIPLVTRVFDLMDLWKQFHASK
jgi:hypothetical protein